MTGDRSITRLLLDWSNGNSDALAELTPHVYRELHALARRYVNRGGPGRTLQPTALINEVYLRLIENRRPIEWESRSHFVGIAARLMRNVLVECSRSRNAEKRGGSARAVTLDETVLSSSGRAPDVLELDEALDRLAPRGRRKAPPAIDNRGSWESRGATRWALESQSYRDTTEADRRAA